MIVVTGSLAYDHIMNFPGKFSDHILPEKLHVLSLSFLVDKLKKEKGGTAGNIAYNLALLGNNSCLRRDRPLLVGCVGTDFEVYRKHLEAVGVNTTGVKVINNEFTSSAFIMTDRMDNQITGFYPGSMSKNKELRIKNYGVYSSKERSELGSFQRNSSHLAEQGSNNNFVVISPNDPEAMNSFVEECIEINLPYMYDPGMQLPRISDKELAKGVSGAKILIGNDYEISVINERLKTKNEELLKKYKNLELIIITLGEKGAKIISRPKTKDPCLAGRQERPKTILISPANPKEVLDPTGAGDAFRGGFLAGYLRGFPLEDCGKMGNLAAVYTVEKYGTQTHYYTLKQFCQRYYENFKEKLNL